MLVLECMAGVVNVTRLPTNDHSVHVWKRREGIEGEGQLGFSLFYMCSQCFMS